MHYMFMTAIHVVVHVAVFFVQYITELEQVGDIIGWLPGGTLLMKNFYFAVAYNYTIWHVHSKFPAPDPA